MMPEQPLPIAYFTKIKNVGDQVNPELIRLLFGRDTVLSDQSERHLLAIGSLIGIANEYSQIWGTGVLHPSFAMFDIPASNVHALRGRLSWQALRDNGIPVGDVPLGDPAFLVSRCCDIQQSPKKYRLGVAAHYVDRAHPWVQHILGDAEVLDLDVHADPSEFFKKTVACEAVVSSSLHGLIFAEAMKVPNLWIKLSDKIHGDGFKFRDWFSLADFPQAEPYLPFSGDTPKSLAARAILHGIQIDQGGLIGSFPFAY